MIIIVLISVVMLAMILVTVMVEKNTAYGTCPKCKLQVGLMNEIGACNNCGEALENVKDQLVVVKSGFIADGLPFYTNLSKLKAPSEWVLVWEDRCCVCGNPAVRRERITIKVVVGHAGPLLAPMNLTKKEQLDAGYCGTHSKGISFLFPPGIANAKSNEQCLLLFQSVDFYREFLRQNGIQDQTAPEAEMRTNSEPDHVRISGALGSDRPMSFPQGVLPVEVAAELSTKIASCLIAAQETKANIDEVNVDLAKIDDLLSEIDSHLHLYPSDFDLLLAKSSAMRLKLQTKSAEEIVDKVLAHDPSHFDAQRIRGDWGTWEHLLQLPACSESAMGISPALIRAAGQGRAIFPVREGLRIGIAAVLGVSNDPPFSISMPCKCDFVLSDTPYGRVVATYVFVQDNPSSPYGQELFLNVDRPRQARQADGYWLMQRLSRLGSMLVILKEDDKVNYCKTYLFPNELRVRLRTMAEAIEQDPRPVENEANFRRASQYHIEQFQYKNPF